jgi:sulfur relay (sulfurtransferase) DsrF/TusC family protein
MINFYSNMSKNTEKRKIPEGIKRQLRQEANFGCCKCGNPIIEYHHIKMWSKVETHHHEDMMVLCPTCHHSIESYPEAYQQKLKANPYNKENTNQSGRIIIAQSFCAIDTGSIFLIGDGPVVRSKNVNYIEVYCNEDDMLEISLQLFNEKNENLIRVVKNEWVTGNAQLWDIEFISASKVLKIKEKKGFTNLEINAKNTPVTIKGELWIDGKPLKLNSNGITYNNISLLTTNKTSDKFGIWHFNQDAYSFRFAKNTDGRIGPCIETRTYESNTICFNGDTYYSGCVIDLSEDGALRLTPKQTPYEMQSNVSLKKIMPNDY